MLWRPNSIRSIASPCLSSASTSHTGSDLPPASICAAVERHFDLGAVPRDEQESPAHSRRVDELERCGVVASVESAGEKTAGAGAGMQRQIRPRLVAGPGRRARHCFLETLRRARAPRPSPSAPNGRATCASAATGPPGRGEGRACPSIADSIADRPRAVSDHGALDGRHRGRDDPELELDLVHRSDSVPNCRPPSHDDQLVRIRPGAPSRSSPQDWPESAAARPDGSGRRRCRPPARPAAATCRNSRCRWPCDRTG